MVRPLSVAKCCQQLTEDSHLFMFVTLSIQVLYCTTVHFKCDAVCCAGPSVAAETCLVAFVTL